MASFIQRGKVWRAMIVRQGKRVSATFDSRAEAEDWAIATEAAIVAGARTVTMVTGSMTVADLMKRYAAQVSPLKKGDRWEQIRLLSLPTRFEVFRRPVQQFDGAALSEWRDQRLRRVSASTVNRELNLISAVMNASMNEWRVPGLRGNPVHMIQRPKMPRARKRRVSFEERGAMCAALGWDGVTAPASTSAWTAFAFCLALETAMRKGEILSLKWSSLHLDERFAHLGDTKNGDERDVPLSSRALAMLRLLPMGEAAQRVIPVHSGTLDMTFRRAKIAAGLADLRFHDSRREAATMMSKKLSNVLELGAVTGHRSLAVLRDYYRPNAGELADKLG
jgi:integrase